MESNWATALPDWEARIMERRSLVPNLPLFTEEAARALRVFKRLRIPDVIGRPTMAEACGPWFFPIVAALFGSYDPETHRRMIQEYFLLIPKKNSKSSNGGAVMLTALIMNRRPEAEFNLIAPTIQIANIAFRQAMGTLKIDPELDKVFHPRPHLRAIEHRINGSVLQIKAADTDVITGGKPVGTMIDETHVFSKKANAADIFVELRGALAARPDGFLFQTTTQSKEPPSGQFKKELNRARAVRDGEISLPMLPILYEYPESVIESEEWRKPENWPMVNPNINRSVDAGFLERELATADREGAEQLSLIASQHFNVEIGLRMRHDAWPGSKYWVGAKDPERITFESLIERAEVVTAGVDGGGLDDLLGLAVCGRDKQSKDWLFAFRAWAHPDVLEDRKEIAGALRQFAEQGDLVICEEPSQDVRELADILERFHAGGLFPEKYGIGLDPVGVAAITDELSGRGIPPDLMSAVFQGYKLSGTIKGFERKLKYGTLWHDGSEMMAWCVGNARVEVRGSADLITKQVSGKAKIDPLVAGFNAFSLMARNPVASGRTVYRERGALVL